MYQYEEGVSLFTSEVFKPSVVEGTVAHARSTPRKHSFSYPSFYLCLDIDSIDKNFSDSILFSHNRKGICSLYDEDYLSCFSGDLREKLHQCLSRKSPGFEYDKALLITHPRLLGWVFNPVSFFLLLRQNGELAGLVAEVHNTFSESHIYVLDESKLKKISKNNLYVYETDKVFHVSPFFSREGFYRFRVSVDENSIDIGVDLFQSDTLVFTSSVKGRRKDFTPSILKQMLLSYPAAIFATSARIGFHAGILKFRRKLQVYTKPIATNESTFRKQGPGILQKLTYSAVSRFLSKAENGKLTIHFPDGFSEIYSGRNSGACNARIDLNNYDLFTRSFCSGDIGFGESYVAGDWDTDSLTDVLKFFCVNLESLNDRSLFSSYLGRSINAIKHYSRANSLSRSRCNIRKHYDLSNDLFSAFLDERMQYSSALFRTHDESLSEAQENKLNALITKAKLTSEDTVLEIGCGWGGLSTYIAEKVGCKVRAITLSQEQADFAKSLVAQKGLQDLVSIEICDYREVQGSYSKIISVEMIEAVGHRYLGEFFSVCEKVLKPDGILVMQAITIPDQRYTAYRLGCDWIQKYIFPGGLCPSIGALVTASSENSQLILESTENIGESYAKTLQIWKQKFNENWKEIEKMGFDSKFRRMWNFYLSYCEAGFSERVINTHQMVFSRANNKSV